MTGGAGLPDPPSPVGGRPGAAHGARISGGWPPHDVPSAAELLDAVREFLESEVVPATEGRVRFHVRVAGNVVGMAARELALGPTHAAAHAARLATLGVRSEAELAAAIRSGALDGRSAEVRAVVRATVADKLSVANPQYARGAGGDADPGPASL